MKENDGDEIAERVEVLKKVQATLVLDSQKL